jgi:sigma-54 specific flagellar transcriptional regulator A
MDSVKMIGNSPAITRVRELIQQVAETSATVLIRGGSGTGKELVAHMIHAASKRAKGAFVPVNCAALPADLLESELFGHEKGAFTGALSTRTGRFEWAENGSLFLDEVGDIPLAMQVKLLRVIQEKMFERVGSNRSLKSNARLIAATHKNLEQAITEHTFREDLYYRLNVFPIEVPALKERMEDLPLLIEHFIEQSCTTHDQPRCEMTQDALSYLLRYQWPGNIRELSNLIERLSIQCSGKKIRASDLPTRFFKADFEEKTQAILIGKPQIPTAFNLKSHLMHLEIDFIQTALQETAGVVSHAALRLGIRRTTLVEKLRKYQLDKNMTVHGFQSAENCVSP